MIEQTIPPESMTVPAAATAWAPVDPAGTVTHDTTSAGGVWPSGASAAKPASITTATRS